MLHVSVMRREKEVEIVSCKKNSEEKRERDREDSEEAQCVSACFFSQAFFFGETVFGFAIRREAHTGESWQAQVGHVLKTRRQNEISGNEKNKDLERNGNS